MKLVVFAHTPPPHHGQSYMVQQMIDALGGDQRRRGKNPISACSNGGTAGVEEREPRIECYHVNARFSSGRADLGRVRLAKLLLALRYSFEALWCRFRYGADTFYFVPAPPKWPALWRDWLVMLICRPFFSRIIHHWHAVGLADWLQHDGSGLSQWLTRRLLGRASLGVALATSNLRDSLWLETKHVEIVHNGIPDPCPTFDATVLPRRRARLEARKRLLCAESEGAARATTPKEEGIFRLLYLGYCLREKGVFETLDGVAMAQQRMLAQNHPLRLHLTVAGDFLSPEVREEFMQRIAQPDLSDLISYTGFVEGAEKSRLLTESDCLCFPTYCDSFGLVVLEAMAVGLNVIATYWGALPEILPPNYPGFVQPRSAEAIADQIPQLFLEDASELRARFLQRFTDAAHARRLYEVLSAMHDNQRECPSKSNATVVR